MEARPIVPRLVVAIGLLSLIIGAVLLTHDLPLLLAPHNLVPGSPVAWAVYMTVDQTIGPPVFAIVLGMGLELLFRLANAVEQAERGKLS